MQVEMKSKAHKAAHEVTKHPWISIAIVVNQEGHTEGTEEVSHCQVDHDDAPALPGTHLYHVNSHGCDISHQAHDEDDGIGDRQVIVLYQCIHISAVLIFCLCVGHGWAPVEYIPKI